VAAASAARGRGNENIWVADIPKTNARSVILGDALLIHSVCRLALDPAVRWFSVDWATVKEAAESDGLKGDGMILVESPRGNRAWHRVYAGGESAGASGYPERSRSGIPIQVSAIQELGDWQIRFDNLATLIQMANSVRRYSWSPLYMELVARLNLTGMATFEELVSFYPADRGLALGAVARMVLERTAFMELDDDLFGMGSVLRAVQEEKAEPARVETAVARDAPASSRAEPALTPKARRGRPRTLASNYTSTVGWPAPDISAVPDDARDDYRHRRDAVELYIANATPEEILGLTGLSMDQTRYFFDRCTTASDDGGIFGFYGILENYRVKAYDRTAPTNGEAQYKSAGFAGALGQALAKFEDVAKWLNETILKEANGQGPRNSNPKLALELKNKLSANGVGDDKWPGCTKNGGAEAIRRYRHELVGLGKPVTGNDTARQANQVGTGHQVVIKSLRPLSFIQLDYQTVGAHAILRLLNRYGKVVKIPLKRWSIGYAGYEYPCVIAGVGTCYEPEPSVDTGLETISSLLDPNDDILYQGRLRRTENGKFLARHFVKELEWNACTVMRWDNARANRSQDMVHNVIDDIGCFICFGPPYKWWARFIIEALINRINANGLARVQSTAGTGPMDSKKKKNPAAVAMRTEFDRDAAEEIIYGAICDYNVSSAGNLEGSSPVDAAASYVRTGNNGFFLRPLPKQTQLNANLLYHCVEATVQVHSRGGKPFLRIKGPHFIGETLASARQFVHKKVLAFLLRRDVRFGKVFAKDTGEALGEIRMQGDRARAPQSWKDFLLFGGEPSAGRKIRDALSGGEEERGRLKDKSTRSASSGSAQAAPDARAILREERTAVLAARAPTEPVSPSSASPPPVPQTKGPQGEPAAPEPIDDPWGIASVPRTLGVHHG
jgi:hypothetical protein